MLSLHFVAISGHFVFKLFLLSHQLHLQSFFTFFSLGQLVLHLALELFGASILLFHLMDHGSDVLLQLLNLHTRIVHFIHPTFFYRDFSLIKTCLGIDQCTENTLRSLLDFLIRLVLGAKNWNNLFLQNLRVITHRCGPCGQIRHYMQGKSANFV